jgi:hypothetical protein
LETKRRNVVPGICKRIPDKSQLKQCDGFKVFHIRVQMEGITGSPELLKSEQGVRKLFWKNQIAKNKMLHPNGKMKHGNHRRILGYSWNRSRFK